jgi:hypothetical protein
MVLLGLLTAGLEHALIREECEANAPIFRGYLSQQHPALAEE